MRDDFSALCGITEEELLTQLKPDIEQMAEANNETYEEACAHLKHQYDGYHFSSGVRTFTTLSAYSTLLMPKNTKTIGSPQEHPLSCSTSFAKLISMYATWTD